MLVLVVCVNNNNNNNERFITLRNDIADQQLKTVSSDINEKEKNEAWYRNQTIKINSIEG